MKFNPFDRYLRSTVARSTCFIHAADDLYLGSFPIADGIIPALSSAENPTAQSAMGVGPMGRIAFLDIVPLTASATNVAASQHMTASTALTLTAGTGCTKGTAPDGSGSAVYQPDVPRCVSLTSTANLSGGNFTLTAYDQYGQKFTSTIAGPNDGTVYFPKAVGSAPGGVLSIVPNTTDGTNNVSAGFYDAFGLPFLVSDAGFIVSNRWANNLNSDPGELITGDPTSPATASTKDVRGLYLPSTASNGSNRLCIGMHLSASQCGSAATLAAAFGVAQA